MAEKVRIGANTVYVYVPGAIVRLPAISPETGEVHKEWEILRTTLTWDQFGQVGQELQIVPIDADGEQLSEQHITVNTDYLDIYEL